MSIEAVLRDLSKELPWVKNSRLVVGPLMSRELIKDYWIKKVKAIPLKVLDLLFDSGSIFFKYKKPTTWAMACATHTSFLI